MTTTGFGGHGEWILDLIASCPTCGTYVTRHVGGPRRRFYTCPGGHLRDAKVLEDAVVAAAADRHWRTNPNDIVRPYFVVHRWRTAAPAEQRGLIQDLIAAVTVDHAGEMHIRWHPTPPERIVAVRCVCYTDGRSRRG